MADFNKADFGDRFKNKVDGKIYEIVGMIDKPAVCLRAEDDTDWTEVIGCPNALNHWEPHKEELGDFLRCLKCNKKLEPGPCPDGEPGCCVMHYRPCDCDKGCNKPFMPAYIKHARYPEDYLICGFTKIGGDIVYCNKCRCYDGKKIITLEKRDLSERIKYFIDKHREGKIDDEMFYIHLTVAIRDVTKGISGGVGR